MTETRAFNRDLWGIFPISITGDIVLYFYPPLELLRQQIVLVQEQYDLSVLQDGIRGNLFPQFVRILKPINTAVFDEFLVKDAERGEEDDRVNVIEEWCP